MAANVAPSSVERSRESGVPCRSHAVMSAPVAPSIITQPATARLTCVTPTTGMRDERTRNRSGRWSDLASATISAKRMLCGQRGDLAACGSSQPELATSSEGTMNDWRSSRHPPMRPTPGMAIPSGAPDDPRIDHQAQSSRGGRNPGASHDMWPIRFVEECYE